MWPVVLCALAVTVLVVWRLAELSVSLGRARSLLDRIDDLIGRRMIAEALAAARGAVNPAARVMAQGLAYRTAGPPHVARAFRNVEVLEVARLERGFIALDAIATLAPLLGALATALSILDADSPVAIAPLATGATVALATSAVHLWLLGRVDRFTRELRRSTTAAVRAIEELDASPS